MFFAVKSKIDVNDELNPITNIITNILLVNMLHLINPMTSKNPYFNRKNRRLADFFNQNIYLIQKEYN